MRTFVVSDAHGYPALIANALEHGGFRPGEDGFVYAGDFLDRGPDPEGCLELVERLATEVLFGNHEAAVFLDFPVFPQDPASRRFRLLLADKAFRPCPVPWKAATCVEGVLVTHAGASQVWTSAFHHECQGDPHLLADHLNEEFLEAVLLAIEGRACEWEETGVLGWDGPLWYRPDGLGGPPLRGCVQIAGHTPPLGDEEESGLYLTDPDTRYGLGDPGRFRYALVEGGRVTVVEGVLGAVTALRLGGARRPEGDTAASGPADVTGSPKSGSPPPTG
jgi:hypothetical protein